MQAELADNNRKVEKEITISMQSASKWLPVLISGFKKQYPDIKIAIVQHTNPMDTMRCDIRISSGRTKIEDTNTITLLEEEILLALPKEHPLATKSSIALTDVKDEPFISLQKGKPLREITDEYCRLAGFEPKVVLESDDPSTIRGFIHLGLGISFIPTITWNNIANSSIALLNISKPKCNRYIYLSWKNTTYISEATKLFRDYAVEFFQKLPLLATTPSSPASNSTDS